ncbi:alpha/beta hydrolase [Stieleria varia]|uniref:Alpha/beta hydrolase family protein n=1 Tax=Stieleria varia TaxID=2528005 RepID=A0A5C6B007_9BACT|nr:alpha/beta fold hydrolase [Stieleria varia]TWU05553.1 Alpha/beta hydrolase family protein [Stieleria varia]
MSPTRKTIKRLLTVASCLCAGGLIVSWFVAGALVAPCPCVIGDAPIGWNTKTIALTSDSGSTISGWHTRPDRGHGVVVLLHGIRGSRLSMVERARLLHDAGYATVMIDLQSHGESLGEVITVGHLEQHDVRAAVQYARREHPGEPIGVIGVSLGGAAALLASPLDLDALVLESVYPNIHAAIDNRVSAKLGPLSPIPTSLLLIQLQLRLGISPSDLRPIDHLSQIECPVCIASGTSDRHTTESETRAMFEAAPEPKSLWLADGAAHVDLLNHDREAYRQQVLGFLNRHLRTGESTTEKHAPPRNEPE